MGILSILKGQCTRYFLKANFKYILYFSAQIVHNLCADTRQKGDKIGAL